MQYSQAVREIRRHQDLSAATPESLALVHYATLAASSHNTQPWKFRLEPASIAILPDFERRCPAVDPDDHHLFASLGCAAANLLLAGEAAGLRGHVDFDAAEPAVRVRFEPAPPARSPLFEAIPHRQCSRSEYDGRALGTSELRRLERAADADGVSLLLLTDPEHKTDIAEFVAEGNRRQFSDEAWADELKHWIRFSAREAVRTGDGLYGPAMGSPSVPRFVGKLAMRFGFTAEKQNEKDLAHIRSSGAIAVFVSDVDDRRHWVEAGRSYERLALEATALGLSTAFINQPVEVASLRREFAAALDLGDRRPDLVVRIGRGPKMPASLRRSVQSVVV